MLRLGVVRCGRWGNSWLRVRRRAGVLGTRMKWWFGLRSSGCGCCGGCLAGLFSIIYRGAARNWSCGVGIVLCGQRIFVHCG